MKEHKWKWVSLILAIALIISISMQAGELNKKKNLQLGNLNSVFYVLEELIDFQYSVTSGKVQLEDNEIELFFTQLKQIYSRYFYEVADSLEGTHRLDMAEFTDDFVVIMDSFIDADSDEEVGKANMGLRDLRQRAMEMYIELEE